MSDTRYIQSSQEIMALEEQRDLLAEALRRIRDLTTDSWSSLAANQALLDAGVCDEVSS